MYNAICKNYLYETSFFTQFPLHEISVIKDLDFFFIGIRWKFVFT